MQEQNKTKLIKEIHKFAVLNGLNCIVNIIHAVTRRSL
jgi:hypothetical protein